MADSSGKRSIFDEDPDEEKRREKRILLDVIIISIVLLVVTIMTIRNGENYFELPCDGCQASDGCEKKCFTTCLGQGYDSVTSVGYNVRDSYLCDCRCDHLLHSMLLGKPCDEGYAKFGDYCCVDLNRDGVCDRYNTLSLSELGDRSISMSECKTECDDYDPCTKDECNSDTDYYCKHTGISPCCGNGLCEETEKCGKCFSDCGGCLSVDSMKKFLEDEFSANEWNQVQDVDKEVVYYGLTNGLAEIMEIGDIKDLLNSFQEFKEFRYVNQKTKALLPNMLSERTLYEKDYFTSRGIINEQLGYWKISGEDGIMFHNFNIFCSEDLYVRLVPEWSTRNPLYSKSFDELTLVSQFQTDRKLILPMAVETLNKCPFGKVNFCTDCSYQYAVENAINDAKNGFEIYIENDVGKFTGYFWDDVVITLTNESFLNEDDLLDYRKSLSIEDANWTRKEIRKLELDISKEPEKQSGGSRYNYYAGHSVSKNEFYSLSKSVNNTLVWADASAVLYNYDVNNEIRGVDDVVLGEVSVNKNLLVTVLRATFPCGNMFIELRDRKSKVYDDDLNENQLASLTNDIKDGHQKLIEDAAIIKTQCDLLAKEHVNWKP